MKKNNDIIMIHSGGIDGRGETCEGRGVIVGCSYGIEELAYGGTCEGRHAGSDDLVRRTNDIIAM